MTRPQFFKEIAERTGIPKQTVAEVVEAEENLIYEIMATCDSFRYIWGTISGIEKPPRRIGGMYREIEAVKRNYGWSNWKFGYPHVKWTKVSKVCDNHSPEEYFAQPEKRYTSLARTFRKEAGLPEIVEFEGLSEEKIEEICKKADDVEWNSLTNAQRWNKSRDMKYNAQKKLAMIDYWEKIGYTPQGVVYMDYLGDKNYTGKQRDTIDYYLETYLKDDMSLPEKFDTILTAIDIAEYKNLLETHPELYEKKKEYAEQIKEQGLKPIHHVKKEYEVNKFSLKYNGEEDPWGINRELMKKYAQRKEESKEAFAEIAEENNLVQVEEEK